MRYKTDEELQAILKQKRICDPYPEYMEARAYSAYIKSVQRQVGEISLAQQEVKRREFTKSLVLTSAQLEEAKRAMALIKEVR